VPNGVPQAALLQQRLQPLPLPLLLLRLLLLLQLAQFCRCGGRSR
jgi:hypothetical protein